MSRRNGSFIIADTCYMLHIKDIRNFINKKNMRYVIIIMFIFTVSSCISQRENTYKEKLELIDSIIESHADDGLCDELIIELNKAGYYNRK